MNRKNKTMIGLWMWGIGVGMVSLAHSKEEEGVIGPWKVEDVAHSPTVADDRPNAESQKISDQYFEPVLATRFFVGENKKLGFRIAPRNKDWAGILICMPDGKPLSLKDNPLKIGAGAVGLVNAEDAKQTSVFKVYDSRYLFSDASRIFFPKTEIRVGQGSNLVDRVVVDFSQWKLEASKIQVSDFVEPTDKHGLVLCKGSDFVAEDGKRMFFWGGRVNHVPAKETIDAFCETYREAGLNNCGYIGVEEMVADPVTVELDPEKLDRFFYMIDRFGKNGIYFALEFFDHWVKDKEKKRLYYGYAKGEEPSGNLEYLDPKYREAKKRFWKKLLTAVNPYNGKALKDDPTLMMIDLYAEGGLNGRRFDYNRVDQPEDAAAWRKSFNEYLLKKYGDREALQKAWKLEPLFKWEDPAKHTIMIPWRFRGERAEPKIGDWPGKGQSDQYTTGKYYYDGTSRAASPRISDAIEWTYRLQYENLKDLAEFLRKECGIKVGIGWSGDGFHIGQVANHKANLDYPGDIASATCYCDWDVGDQTTSRTKNLKRFAAMTYIYNRPTYSYEWGGWATMSPFQYEYILLAALMWKVYGYDGGSFHKVNPFIYPISDPEYTYKRCWIDPLTDRRRGPTSLALWILMRSKVQEIRNKIIYAYPHDSAVYGGPCRIMSNPCFENWLLYQLASEDYGFKDVYDGPTDRIVIHEGRGPYGDYRKAKHAILWCHGNTDREGKDFLAKEKWFALHGIKFEPGQNFYLDDKYLAINIDVPNYNDVHWKAEHTRWDLLHKNAQEAKDKDSKKMSGYGVQMITADHYYWDAEPDAKPTEVDLKIYEALKRWGYPLPFSEDEIDKVWRHPDRTMEMDTRKECFVADREDLQVWLGRKTRNPGPIQLKYLSAESDEKQYAVMLLAWDTADFKTSKTLALWCLWNSKVTVKLPFKKAPEIYAVNWLGKRLFKVKPVETTKDSVTFWTARHDDVFVYEIAR